MDWGFYSEDLLSNISTKKQSSNGTEPGTLIIICQKAEKMSGILSIKFTNALNRTKGKGLEEVTIDPKGLVVKA